VATLHAKILDALRTRASDLDEVQATYAEIEQEVGAARGLVHLAMLQMRDDGVFPSNPTFLADAFIVRLAPAHRCPTCRGTGEVEDD